MPSFSSKNKSSSPSVAVSSFFNSIPFRWKRQSYELNAPDAEFNVVYLGNVLTMMAKGDESIEKPLNVIWRTYNAKKQMQQHNGGAGPFGEIVMKLRVTRAGLKAETKQLGLTEYWAHRITYCAAPMNYPRIFCWVYKHEGKRMRPELRCHAVLCRKAVEPNAIANDLQIRLKAALMEYKREKMAMERARKHSSNSSGGGLPRRRLLLQTGTLYFRPPVSRAKSVPRLNSIDEEDEPEEVLETMFEEETEEDLFAQCSDTDSMSYNYRTIPMESGSNSLDDQSSVSSSGASSAPSSTTTTRSLRTTANNNNGGDTDSGASVTVDSSSGGSGSGDEQHHQHPLYFSSIDSPRPCRSVSTAGQPLLPFAMTTTTAGSSPFAVSAPPGSIVQMFNDYLIV